MKENQQKISLLFVVAGLMTPYVIFEFKDESYQFHIVAGLSISLAFIALYFGDKLFNNFKAINQFPNNLPVLFLLAFLVTFIPSLLAWLNLGKTLSFIISLPIVIYSLLLFSRMLSK